MISILICIYFFLIVFQRPYNYFSVFNKISPFNPNIILKQSSLILLSGIGIHLVNKKVMRFIAFLTVQYFYSFCSFAWAGCTKQVRLTVNVDKESARAMNSGDEKLEDILVLHLEGGKDFFVSLEFT